MDNYTNRGEYRTYQMLKKLSKKYPEDKFHVFGNLFLDYQDNTPNRQVDHLVICRNGVFMIETKYWLGTTYHNIQLSDLTAMVGGPEMRNEPLFLLSKLLPEKIINLDENDYFTMCIKHPTDIQVYSNYDNPIKQVRHSGFILNKIMGSNDNFRPYIHEFVFYNYVNERDEQGVVVDLNHKLDKPYNDDFRQWGEGFTSPQAFKDFYDDVHEQMPNKMKLNDQQIENVVNFIHEEVVLDR